MPELKEEERRGSGSIMIRRREGHDEEEQSTGGLVGDDFDDDAVDDDEQLDQGEPVDTQLDEQEESDEIEEAFAAAEEEGEEEERPARTTKRRPSTRRASRSRPRNIVKTEVEEDFQDVLGSLQYGPDQHKVVVTRLEPMVDVNTGKRIGGLQGTFHRPITPDEIQKVYGGGVFKVTVHGPRPDTGRGTMLKAAKQIEIAGDPIPVKSSQDEERKRKAEERKEDDLVKTLLDREDRRAEEAKRDSREAMTMQLKMMEKLAERPKEDPSAAMNTMMAPMLTMMQENERRREEQARADREREDRRRETELAEQRRREEQERLRHEADMRRQEQQFKLQMEQIKMQQESMKTQMIAESNNGKQSLEMMMAFMQRADSDKENRAKEQTQLQVQVMGQMNEMQRSMLEGQLQMMQSQLAEAKNKDDFFEYMEKFQTIQALLNPGDDREGWERAFDKVADTLPTVIPGLAALGGMRQPQGSPSSQATADQRMLPGSVAVVEDIERMQAQVAGRPVAGVNGPAVIDPNAFPTPQLAATEEEEAPQEEPVMQNNDLTDFVPYPESGDNEEVLILLVKMLDLGIGRGLDVDALYDKCIVPMPPQQRAFLKMLPVDVISNFIENNVPESWPIRSLEGDEKLREIHEKVVAAA